jgi:hypothetical protein
MSNSQIALALVALALGVTLMEIFAGTNHAGAPSQRDRGSDIHGGSGNAAAKSV